MFDDLLDANRRYQSEFHDSGVPGKAAKGLAVLTCIDSRIDPLAMLGLKAGDAKILRNAGARVTDDALRSLVLAANFLFADSSSWPLWFAVPLTAALGYGLAESRYTFPAHELTALPRALPIHYMSAGLAGAILGYYASIKLRMHNLMETPDEKGKEGRG